jgi:phenylalanyl-tRNA synthetase beta subunit
MKVSYNWLQDYLLKPLLPADELARVLTMQAFEVESVESHDGDYLLDIDVLPNRMHDCLSHLGIAREIAVLTGNTLKHPEAKPKVDAGLKTGEYLTLTVENPNLVRRAMKRLVTDVQVGESPAWLKEKLKAIGQRSINNIVDITNFVTFETGQPVHAFDYDKLAGGDLKHVTIRGARSGEKITTLDGDEYELEEEMLVIADDEKALDIAGIKGGANSGIDADTKRVVLSVCNFYPTNIRKTSRKLGFLTDASKRFEQEITPELTLPAMERLSALVAELAGGRVAADTLDNYPCRRKSYKVGVSTHEVNKLLGTILSDKDVEGILNRLGFEYEKIVPIEKVLALAPTLDGVLYKYGASISYDAPELFDCSSFIVYLFAQGGISIPRMVVDQYVFGEEVQENGLQPGDIVFANRGADGTTEYIESLDVQQTRHTTESQDFLPGTKAPESTDHNGMYIGDGKVIHASGTWDKGKVVIENLKESKGFQKIVGFRRIPGATEERYVVTPPAERLDLMSARSFLASGVTADLIEEIGRVYGYDNIAPSVPKIGRKPEINRMFYYTNKIRDILVAEGFSEVYTYAFQDKGEVEVANPLANDKAFLRASLKGGLNQSFEQNARHKDLLGLDAVRIFEIGTVFAKDREHIALGIKGNGAGDALKTLSAQLGAPLTAPLEGDYTEVNVTELVDELPEPKSYDGLVQIDTSAVTYKPFSLYPFVLRDIAVWTPAGTKYTDVWETIWKTAKPSGLLGDRISVFDNYIKKDERGLEEKRSYAYHLVFQSYEKTLSDTEVNEVMEKITKEIEKKGWEVR